MRASATDAGTAAVGASVDLVPILASAVGEVLLHAFGAAVLAQAMLPVVGVVLMPVVAIVRTKYTTTRVRAEIVKGLVDKRKEILLDQRVKLVATVEDGFKKLSDPIYQSTESEVAVIKANMHDIVEQRRKADFDANAYEVVLRDLERAVDRRVGEIQRLAS
jgi:hypothetical protein